MNEPRPVTHVRDVLEPTVEQFAGKLFSPVRVLRMQLDMCERICIIFTLYTYHTQVCAALSSRLLQLSGKEGLSRQGEKYQRRIKTELPLSCPF